MIAIRQGSILLSFIVWLLLTGMIYPLLTKTLLLLTHTYSKVNLLYLELTELEFLKIVIQKDLSNSEVEHLSKNNDSIILTNTISDPYIYSISKNRFKRLHKKTQYLTNKLKIKQLTLANSSCISINFYNPLLPESLLCQPQITYE